MPLTRRRGEPETEGWWLESRAVAVEEAGGSWGLREPRGGKRAADHRCRRGRGRERERETSSGRTAGSSERARRMEPQRESWDVAVRSALKVPA